MDGLFHGKPYEQMDDLGGFPIIFGLETPIWLSWSRKAMSQIGVFCVCETEMDRWRCVRLDLQCVVSAWFHVGTM